MVLKVPKQINVISNVYVKKKYYLFYAVWVFVIWCSIAGRMRHARTHIHTHIGNPPLGLAESVLMHYGNKVKKGDVISLELPP